MHFRRQLTGALFGIVVLLLAVGSSAQKPASITPDRELQRRSFATEVLHALNNAEQDYKKKHGKFTNWEMLVGDGYFTESGTKWVSPDYSTVGQAMYGRGPEIVPGWKLRLSISNDGNSYDALLQDVTDAKCGFATLTDERGVIRQSKFASCAQ